MSEAEWGGAVSIFQENGEAVSTVIRDEGEMRQVEEGKQR